MRKNFFANCVSLLGRGSPGSPFVARPEGGVRLHLLPMEAVQELPKEEM